ncbi:MAG: hypothetical protein K0S39_5801 [Paenibacillus sp.]|jgi:hypothetical protein|nr:hypothetical protein [Paenibacillus sp.]
MNIHRMRDRSSTRIIFITVILFTVLCLAFSAWSPGVSLAGKEGVFINNSVYFTLEDVALSIGSDNQTMRFQLKLNNDGESVIDFNHYGVKVSAANGGSYYAELSRQAEAQVAPHHSASYYFVSNIAGGLVPSQLYVTLFERNGSSLRDLGSLSVANAQSVGEQDHQLLVNLADVDSAVTMNSFVSFQAVKAVAIPEDGKWTVLVDTTVTPTGNETVTLPSGLNYLLHDGQGRILSLSANAVDGSSIHAGQTKHVLLTTTLDTLPSTDDMTLDLSLDSAGISSLGKLSLAPLFQLSKTGERVPYAVQGREGITLELQKAEEQQLSNQQGALLTAVLHNDSKSTLPAPSLRGVLYSAEDMLSVNAETVVTPESYIAPGESGIYKFAARLPDGTSAGKLQFLISESASSQAAKSSSTTASGTSSAAETSTTAETSSASTGTTATSTASAAGSQTGVQSASTTTSMTSTVPILAVTLQEGLAAGSNLNTIPPYELGQSLVFDSGSQLMDDNLDVSVVELNGHTNSENGYQTVIAKFKFLNKSNETLQLPAFDTSLTDSSGTSYPGVRQTTALQELIPNAAYVYSYSYMLPPSASGEFKLSILDSSNSSNVKVPIADYKVTVKVEGGEDPHAVKKELPLYPFNVIMDYWTLNAQYNSGTYTYKLKANLDIQKVEQVIVDDSFSTLEFELVDAANRVLGSTTQKLQGTGKLISGLQTINFTDIASEQLVYPVTVRIYENITTSAGSARRLLSTLTQ